MLSSAVFSSLWNSGSPNFNLRPGAAPLFAVLLVAPVAPVLLVSLVLMVTVGFFEVVLLAGFLAVAEAVAFLALIALVAFAACCPARGPVGAAGRLAFCLLAADILFFVQIFEGSDSVERL